MRRAKKVPLVILALLVVIFAAAGCGTATNSQSTNTQASTRIITDQAGKQVKIPTNILRIADDWPAHNEVLAMLGAGDKIVATTTADTPANRPWLAKVNPQMYKAIPAFDTDINVEELLKANPDIAFLPVGDKYVDRVEQAGIPVVQTTFTDFNSLKTCFQLTADVLGGNAPQRAAQYVAYLDSKLKMVTAVTSQIPMADRPKVLHLTSISPNIVDGGGTIQDAWIKAAGGINVAESVKGSFKEVSMEQILKWNPDVIILGTPNSGLGATHASLIKTDPRWQQINAVKNGRVYVNPNGAFMWDRYSAEEALEIQWAAKTLHPDKFKNIDMNQETRYFYKTFLNYNLTKDEANRILNCENPAQ